MKKVLKNFAGTLLSREELKSVKGGDFYCKCAEGNPVPNPNNQDCMYVCTGTSPSSTSWSQNGSGTGGSYTGGTGSGGSFYNGDCNKTTMYDGNGTYITSWTYGNGCP